MSVGPLGNIAGSAAGSPLAQTEGSLPQRTGQVADAEQPRIERDRKADSAAAIDQADGEDHETEDRDADGRRLWEQVPETPDQRPDDDSAPGPRGRLLDLDG